MALVGCLLVPMSGLRIIGFAALARKTKPKTELRFRIARFSQASSCLGKRIFRVGSGWLGRRFIHAAKDKAFAAVTQGLFIYNYFFTPMWRSGDRLSVEMDQVFEQDNRWYSRLRLIG